MKTLTAILLLLAAAAAYGQTVKTLGYNTTNGVVISTNRIIFPFLGAAGGTAAIPSLTVSSGTNTFGLFASTQIAVGPYLGFSVDGTRRFFISTNTIRAEQPISFSNVDAAAATRTNLFGHGGISTNFVVGTNTLVFTNGILREIQ